MYRTKPPEKNLKQKSQKIHREIHQCNSLRQRRNIHEKNSQNCSGEAFSVTNADHDNGEGAHAYNNDGVDDANTGENNGDEDAEANDKHGDDDADNDDGDDNADADNEINDDNDNAWFCLAWLCFAWLIAVAVPLQRRPPRDPLAPLKNCKNILKKLLELLLIISESK